MSTSVTQGIPDVPDGLTLYTDSDGCPYGCYVRVSLSDELVISGTANQADFVYKMYDEQCKGDFQSGSNEITSCTGAPTTVVKTESYYNSTDESFWFDAELSGTAKGEAAIDRYMTVLRGSALGAVRETGQWNDLFPCRDGFLPNADPDMSAGCDPHENRYGYMSSRVSATMYDLGEDGLGGKNLKGELELSFSVQKTENGFCNALQEFGSALSIAPLGTGSSTALGVANYIVGLACS
ncbi:hypothetical protein A1Q1_01873 [Trichosporon asahii var. asahii CBS 2479]|uniref:Uncharacterized protein n=1 Tax=Trichosporon asahii var. asahii (strain ATCC 90039 / CBS 2479 / JCM 2466 / KCTC 7840 / NBRC 103889/ NCYC 2677 / UAMH 7654) TaxID=1186058 RepID=J6F1L5_TRIAS|nr:hypothetical protein A1Q1_01873 [Trichosporon asahii var. asahii CBS 2479]EJT49042.1 hypothetical protein A1Q1_01873 [Trichosporon asahii var. asahii CBS 2479]